jgi:hypothetical protein
MFYIKAYVNSMLVNIILDERKVLQSKSCLEPHSDVIRIYGVFSTNADDIMQVFHKNYIHCHSNLSKLIGKSALVNTSFSSWHGESLAWCQCLSIY